MRTYLGTLRGERGAAGLGLLALMVPVAALVGVAGFALQRSTVDDVAAAVELPDNRYAAPVVSCPGGTAVGQLHNGDRVFAIGVHDDADGWLLIRNPVDPTEHWYIEARWVTADAATGDLPEVGCDDDVPADVDDGPSEIALASDETTTTDPDESTTTTDPDGSTTTSTVPGQTTTTQAGSDPGPQPSPGPGPKPDPDPKPDPKPDPPSTTSSTTQAPPPKPTIGTVFAGQPSIFERYSGGYDCGGPSTSTIVAQDVANATSVTMSWTGAGSGSRSMKLVNNSWAIALGPFDVGTIPDYGPTETVHVTVEATGPGGSTTRSTTVTLHDCTFG